MDCKPHSIYEELVRCPICAGRLRTPRTLPCRHTFCEECLGTAILRSPTAEEIKSEKESQKGMAKDGTNKQQIQNEHRIRHKTTNARSFPCPVCGTSVAPCDPSKPISHWADDFDTDDLVRRILLTLEIKEGTHTCEVCAQRSNLDPVIATCWCRNCCQSICANCAEIHLAFKTSDRHHVIEGLEQLRKTSIGIMVPEPTCATHQRSLEFYCSSCSKSACYLCLKNEHKKCLGVITVKEKALEFQEYGRGTLNKIEDQLNAKEEDLKWIREHIEELHAKKIEVNDRVKKASDELIKMMEEKTNNFIQEIETIIEAELTTFQNQVQTHEKDIDSLNTSRDFMTEFFQSVSDADLISVNDEIEKFLPQTEKSSDINAVDINVNINKEFIESFKKIQNLPLGHVVVSKLDGLSTDNPNLFSPSLSESIQISDQTNNDANPTERSILLCSFKTHEPEVGEEESSPSNITITADEHIIVTDSKNIKLKKFTQQGQLVAQISLASDPFCACPVNEKEIVVTLPYIKQIVFIQDRNTALTLECRIPTRKKYASIAPLRHSRFVCGSLTPNGIDVISQCGDVLSSFNKLSATTAQIQCPLFISVISEKAILISDLGTNALICCDLQGRVRFVHHGEGEFTLKYPRAVTHDNNGFIYVADEKADAVYRFFPDGSPYDILLSKTDGLDHPFGLCASGGNKLAVTEGRTGYIKIYEIPIPF